MSGLNIIAEEQVKLSCLEEIARRLAIQLLSHYSCNKIVKMQNKTLTTSSDPAESLSQILQSTTKAQRKFISELPNLRKVNKEIFRPGKKDFPVVQSIDVGVWDLAPLVCLLQHVPLFDTSKAAIRFKIKCPSPSHAAIQCCPRSEPDKNMYCKYCSKRLNEKSIICCSMCNLCSFCYLRSNRSPCVTSELREALDVIRKLRNTIHHTASTEFSRLSTGTFNNSEFPNCRTLQDLWMTCSPQVVTMLDYLHQQNVVSDTTYNRDLDDVENVILSSSKKELLGTTLYHTAIDRLIQGNIAQDAVKTQLDLASRKTVKFIVKFSLHRLKSVKFPFSLFVCGSPAGLCQRDCDLTSPLSKTIKKCMRDFFMNNIPNNTYYPDIKTNECSIRLHNPTIQKTSQGNSLAFKLVVQAVEDHTIPSCYEHEDTKQSEVLWDSLKIAIKTAIEDAQNCCVDVSLIDWRVGSINITLAVIRTDQQLWSAQEKSIVCSTVECYITGFQVSDELKVVSVDMDLEEYIQYEVEIGCRNDYDLHAILELLPGVEEQVVSYMENQFRENTMQFNAQDTYRHVQQADIQRNTAVDSELTLSRKPNNMEGDPVGNEFIPGLTLFLTSRQGENDETPSQILHNSCKRCNVDLQFDIEDRVNDVKVDEMRFICTLKINSFDLLQRAGRSSKSAKSAAAEGGLQLLKEHQAIVYKSDMNHDHIQHIGRTQLTSMGDSCVTLDVEKLRDQLVRFIASPLSDIRLPEGFSDSERSDVHGICHGLNLVCTSHTGRGAGKYLIVSKSLKKHLKQFEKTTADESKHILESTSLLIKDKLKSDLIVQPTDKKNPISAVYEYAQSKNLPCSFDVTTAGESSKHTHEFQCVLIINDSKVTTGFGTSKKNAKLDAAMKGLNVLKNKQNIVNADLEQNFSDLFCY